MACWVSVPSLRIIAISPSISKELGAEHRAFAGFGGALQATNLQRIALPEFLQDRDTSLQVFTLIMSAPRASFEKTKYATPKTKKELADLIFEYAKNL